MKNNYDKLLLLLAVLALLGGVATFLLKTEPESTKGSDFVLQPADNPYQAVPVPDPATKNATWPEPVHQSSGPNWLYDVFTPPKIYLDAEGKFTAEPPKQVGPPEPFGIYLAEMERKPYRIQMQGFSGARDKLEDTVLFLFDVERQLRFSIRPGQSNAEAEIELIDFTVQREINAALGKVEVIAVATILDKRSDEEVQLNDEEPLFESELSLIFRSEEDPSVDVKLNVEPSNPVTPFETPAGKFILKKINLEDRTVTVEKQATEEEESEAKSRTLSPVNFIQPEESESGDMAPSASETEQETEENNEIFGEENSLELLL